MPEEFVNLAAHVPEAFIKSPHGSRRIIYSPIFIL